jgi:hypothetical protein
VLGEKIGRTGADVRTWMLAGSILLGLGIASFVIVERTRRNNG